MIDCLGDDGSARGYTGITDISRNFANGAKFPASDAGVLTGRTPGFLNEISYLIQRRSSLWIQV